MTDAEANAEARADIAEARADKAETEVAEADARAAEAWEWAEARVADSSLEA